MCPASLATSVPVMPMATPMSARLQRRRVVHAVAGHGHEFALVLQRLHDLDLLLRRHARVHAHALDMFLELRHVQARQLPARQDLRVFFNNARGAWRWRAPWPDGRR